jgi:hypothetical protein
MSDTDQQELGELTLRIPELENTGASGAAPK